MKRPEYVHCIQRYRVTEANTSYCGRDLSMEFKFLDPAHAAHSDRLMTCPECAAAFTELLRKQTWTP